jgi:hypothetical protein
VIWLQDGAIKQPIISRSRVHVSELKLAYPMLLPSAPQLLSPGASCPVRSTYSV